MTRTVNPIRRVVECPNWCTVDHSTGGVEMHSATLLEEDDVTLEASCMSEELAGVVIYVNARDGIPAPLAIRVASALSGLSDLVSAGTRMLEVTIARPTPATVREVSAEHPLKILELPDLNGRTALAEEISRVWQDGRDGYLALHLDPYDEGCCESGSLLLFVRPGADGARVEALARSMMQDEAARWELKPDWSRSWELPLWLI